MGTTTRSLPQNTYSLEDFITSGANVSITYDKLSFKERLTNGTEISILNVVNDYLPEIKELCSHVTLTNAEYQKYKYKPKLLCYDVYGNPEIYFVIMLLNGIIDVKEFDMQSFKMLKVDRMNTVLSYIYNAEKTYISNYNTDKGTV